MKKVMVSQRMNGVEDSVIKETRKRIINYVSSTMFPDEKVEIVDSYVEEYPPDNIPNKAVWYLGKSIQKLAEADLLVVESGAEDARGCKIEMDVARAYGIEICVLPSLWKPASELNQEMKEFATRKDHGMSTSNMNELEERLYSIEEELHNLVEDITYLNSSFTPGESVVLLNKKTLNRDIDKMYANSLVEFWGFEEPPYLDAYTKVLDEYVIGQVKHLTRKTTIVELYDKDKMSDYGKKILRRFTRQQIMNNFCIGHKLISKNNGVGINEVISCYIIEKEFKEDTK